MVLTPQRRLLSNDGARRRRLCLQRSCSAGPREAARWPTAVAPSTRAAGSGVWRRTPVPQHLESDRTWSGAVGAQRAVIMAVWTDHRDGGDPVSQTTSRSARPELTAHRHRHNAAPGKRGPRPRPEMTCS